MRGRKKEYRECEICGKNSNEIDVWKTEVNGQKRTLCSKHYQLIKYHGREYSLNDLKKGRTCDICGISNNETSIMTTEKFGKKMNLCKRHYEQLYVFGKVSNKKDNKYIEKDNYYELILYTRNGEENGIALFSKEHYQEVKRYRWWAFKTKWNTIYVYGQDENGNQMKLHSLICKLLYGEPPEGMTPDHLNRNPLDNRNDNLKYKDASDQMVNQGICKRNTSGVKGVSLYKNRWWRVRLMYRHKELVKIFDTFEEAVEQRKKWEKIRDEGEWNIYYDKCNSLHRS